MRTGLVGRIAIEEGRLAADLETIGFLPMLEPYSEYSCGRPWRSCIVWAPGGAGGDGILKHYDASRPGAPTKSGDAVPYVMEAITRYFKTDRLRFARLAVVTDNVLLPHRDYVEFDDDQPLDERVAHRLHVVLATTADCLFLENDVAFRMQTGEVWSLDVSRLHSAAVLSGTIRIHLILDFGTINHPTAVLRTPPRGPLGIPDDHVVPRPVLSDAEREALLALAGVLGPTTIYQVLAIVIKKACRRSFGERHIWETMGDIAARRESPELRRTVAELQRYCALERAW